MHDDTPVVNPATTAHHEADLRELAALRAERNADRYIAMGIDPWTHAATLRAVASHYRRKAAAIGGHR